MSTIVYRIAVLLGAILADVPVGTNLGLFWRLWALLSGRFLLSRGAVFPALADGGLPADAVRRSGAALASSRAAEESPSPPSCCSWSPRSSVRFGPATPSASFFEASGRETPR